MTPSFARPGQPAEDQWRTEEHLVSHIQCQIAAGVKAAIDLDNLNPQNPPDRRAAWLQSWGAKVSLSLAIENKDNLAPALTFNHTLQNVVSVFRKGGNVTNSQNQGVGISGGFSSDATRTETLAFFYSFADLLKSGIDPQKCVKSQGLFLSSDLRLSDFLQKGVDMSIQPGVLYRSKGQSPYQTFTYEVKFIVTKSGSVNPTWKLVNVSFGQTGQLYTASRMNTDDLLITMGPVKQLDGQPPQSTPELDAQHNANLIGQAVANAIQSRPIQ